VLGLFDSGLGGLTVLRRVHELLPAHDLLFLADQAHVPYGDRSEPDLLHLLSQNLTWLDESGVDAIVMACNTSCAMGERFGWPQTRTVVLDLIESAAMAVERAGYTRVGVVATAATARSGSYARTICVRVPDAHVVEIGAPALVPLVEAGKLKGDEPRSAVREVCAALPRDLDAVVLACTHYPMLQDHFAEALGAAVALIDPALVQAERAAALARASGLTPASGRIECVTNGDIGRFRESLDRLIGDLQPQARHLVLAD
jgi:glutamate racemase